MSLEYVKYFNLFGEEVAQVPSILGNGKPEDQIDNIMVNAAEPGCFYMDITSGDLYKSTWENNEIKWKIVGSGSAEGAVLYTEQKLTDEQKAQARANIGAVSLDEVLLALPNGDEVAY